MEQQTVQGGSQRPGWTAWGITRLGVSYEDGKQVTDVEAEAETGKEGGGTSEQTMLKRMAS